MLDFLLFKTYKITQISILRISLSLSFFPFLFYIYFTIFNNFFKPLLFSSHHPHTSSSLSWLSPAMFSESVCRKLLVSFTCLLLMIVMSIVRLLKGCSNSLLAKVYFITFCVFHLFLVLVGLYSELLLIFVVVVVVAVTVVESGTRALQYLGLDGDTSSIGFDVSKFWIFCFRNLLFIVLFEVFMWLFWWIWLQGVKVNMIMTDYSMPGMTGYELLKKIKVCVLFFEF